MHIQVAEALSKLNPIVVNNTITTFGETDYETKGIIIGVIQGHIRCSGNDAADFLNRLTSIPLKWCVGDACLDSDTFKVMQTANFNAHGGFGCHDVNYPIRFGKP